MQINSTTDNVCNPSLEVLGGYDVAMQQGTLNTRVRLGVVNFLNTAPLIDGIGRVDGVDLIPRVPSELIGCLERGEVDIALASSIDYQRSAMEFRILPCGVLSSDGETLTVRLCSRTPLEDITEIHCDTDSHTSVALLQIILNNTFDTTPNIVTSDIRSLGEINSHWPETILIIGDKVVAHAIEMEYPYQLDLGQAWKDQTGLPFVFAMWFGRQNLDSYLVRRASMLLDRQLRFNMNRLEQVVSSHAKDRGWETGLAFQYVKKHLQYQCTKQHFESLTLFYDLALSCGVIDVVQPLRFFSD